LTDKKEPVNRKITTMSNKVLLKKIDKISNIPVTENRHHENRFLMAKREETGPL